MEELQVKLQDATLKQQMQIENLTNEVSIQPLLLFFSQNPLRVLSNSLLSYPVI